MDPLSIATGCVSLVGIITKLSLTIHGFVRDVRSARGDLDGVSRELSSLKTVLQLLEEDVSRITEAPLPEVLSKHVANIITNCSGVVKQVEGVLEKHRGNRLEMEAKWAFSGKGDVDKLKSSLEAHKSALDLALDMLQLSITRDIKADTNEILNNTAAVQLDTEAIKQDTAQILGLIASLQARLPAQAEQHASKEILERYLNDCTSYAETVIEGGIDVNLDDSPSTFLSEEELGQDENPTMHEIEMSPSENLPDDAPLDDAPLNGAPLNNAPTAAAEPTEQVGQNNDDDDPWAGWTKIKDYETARKEKIEANLTSTVEKSPGGQDDDVWGDWVKTKDKRTTRKQKIEANLTSALEKSPGEQDDDLWAFWGKTKDKRTTRKEKIEVNLTSALEESPGEQDDDPWAFWGKTRDKGTTRKERIEANLTSASGKSPSEPDDDVWGDWGKTKDKRTTRKEKIEANLTSALEKSPGEQDDDLWGDGGKTEEKEIIRKEKIEANLAYAVEKYPDALTKQSMLYIDVKVNNHPRKAFIGTGIQMSFMSPACAKACGILNLLDERYAGTAHGLGTRRIFGRVHSTTIQIAGKVLRSQFTIMDDTDSVPRIGLDLLLRHQACIDFVKNELRFPFGTVKFAPGPEWPKK